MTRSVITLLEQHGIQPSPQRVAVAGYVLSTEDHPTADQVWQKVRKKMPQLSRATVYNTLNLFVDKGLLRQFPFEDSTIFDPNVAPHHHFIDETSGKILDLPWDALTVAGVEALPDCEVYDYHVTLRGRRTPSLGKSKSKNEPR